MPSGDVGGRRDRLKELHEQLRFENQIWGCQNIRRLFGEAVAWSERVRFVRDALGVERELDALAEYQDGDYFRKESFSAVV